MRTPTHGCLARLAFRCGLVCFSCLAAAGCTGGLHRRGDHQVSLLGSYGHPIKGDVIWPDGEGRADNGGVAVGYNYFVGDRFSVGAAITPYRNYNQSEGDAYAGEFQIALRYYVAEWELIGERASRRRGGDSHSPAHIARVGDSYLPAHIAPVGDSHPPPPGPAATGPAPALGIFVEALGGLMQSNRSVPEGGSHTNFTQDAGLGLELRLADNVSWMTGYRLRHVSNGNVFGGENPSQNDHQAYMGVAFSW